MPAQGLVLIPGTTVGSLDDVVGRALEVGLRRIQMLAWRDLDDPEAGGSERHAHHVASRWAAAGLDVTLRTSEARAIRRVSSATDIGCGGSASATASSRGAR